MLIDYLKFAEERRKKKKKNKPLSSSFLTQLYMCFISMKPNNPECEHHGHAILQPFITTTGVLPTGPGSARKQDVGPTPLHPELPGWFFWKQQLSTHLIHKAMHTNTKYHLRPSEKSSDNKRRMTIFHGNLVLPFLSSTPFCTVQKPTFRWTHVANYNHASLYYILLSYGCTFKIS